mgnify:CR=1 FL=1
MDRTRGNFLIEGPGWMDKYTFGLTMLIVGMGGTLLTLGVMSIIMTILKKIFPYREEAGNKKSGAA